VICAVHSDRSGRVVVASDWAAASFDGVTTGPFHDAIPLPAEAAIVPLSGREAEGLDHGGRLRRLGAARFAVAAVLPPGWLRLALPAYAEAGQDQPLAPRAYVAVGADEHGELVAAAASLDGRPGASAPTDLGARVSATLRARAANRELRQLARCARDYACRAAANAFMGRDDCALPVGAPQNERAATFIALRDDRDATPTEPAAFHPSPEEIADVAAAHLEAGGTLVAFGRACEGEPLLAVREIEDAVRRIRARAPHATIHLETNGSLPVALRRLYDAGVDSIAIRLASGRADTYEAIHRPEGYRFTDVRASLGEAAGWKVALSLVVLALPGLTDRPRELDAIVALAGELPPGSALVLRDLAADPRRALALASGDGPLGMRVALERLRADASHLVLAATARPLARV